MATILLTGLFAPIVAGHDPLAQDLNLGSASPNPQYLFGTDKLGRDVFARLAFGAHFSIAIGFVAIGLASTTLVLGFNLPGDGLRDALDPADR